MPINIETRVEKARGCGYRKEGGFYLVADGVAAACCKLPFELTVCPCCDQGIHQTRGFRWISSSMFQLQDCVSSANPFCCMAQKSLRMGLMWVGEKFYPTAEHFTKEAASMGVSKRIAQLPTDFKAGETWIALAHPKAITEINDGVVTHRKGIFRAFRPKWVEYVVRGDESQKELEKIARKGTVLVRVVKDTALQSTLDVDTPADPETPTQMLNDLPYTHLSNNQRNARLI